MCQILGILDPCTDNLGDSGQEICPGSRELIATNESTVFAKLVFDARVVEDGEGDRCFPDPPCTNEGNGLEIFGEPNHPLNEVVASKTCSWWRGR